ncbi:MAG: carboxypeptidase regulatory-like domain-containing protein [Crocinitomicaceae bacterium]|nr:carboxypeptidase regulatory-like domain-containing protein [Crocinitomicaceae bacterium]MBK8927662.1 carboxypeptidase regulatory-like domain-containing protein [Crocinitomicaceae bacterium]
MQKKLSFIAFSSLSLISLVACNKTEGPGGTSSITGIIHGIEFEPAKTEITEVIVSQGSELEHGDYWLINNSTGGTFYYVWYNNPGWISDGDPHLEGRTGIEVSFNYSDSNLDIATNTSTAITTIAGANFDVTVQQDVLVLTNKIAGAVPDANNMTTNFEINIADQGEDEFFGDAMPLADARVYLVYGNETTYGDEVRTGGDGDFRFNNLVKGNYSLYVVSQDTVNSNATVKNSVTLEIKQNKSVVDVGVLEMVY